MDDLEAHADRRIVENSLGAQLPLHSTPQRTLAGRH
jgi:hypothetical protein